MSEIMMNQAQLHETSDWPQFKEALGVESTLLVVKHKVFKLREFKNISSEVVDAKQKYNWAILLQRNQDY